MRQSDVDVEWSCVLMRDVKFGYRLKIFLHIPWCVKLYVCLAKIHIFRGKYNHSTIRTQVPAKRHRDMDKRSWTRNLQTHPDLVDYWKQKVRLRERRVGRLGDEALGVLRGEMDGLDLRDDSTQKV